MTAAPRELAIVLAIMAFSLVCGCEPDLGFDPEHAKVAFCSTKLIDP
jgi:hypothetical protein